MTFLFCRRIIVFFNSFEATRILPRVWEGTESGESWSKGRFVQEDHGSPWGNTTWRNWLRKKGVPSLSFLQYIQHNQAHKLYKYNENLLIRKKENKVCMNGTSASHLYSDSLILKVGIWSITFIVHISCWVAILVILVFQFQCSFVRMCVTLSKAIHLFINKIWRPGSSTLEAKG